MTFDQLKAAYESRHPNGELFTNLPAPKGRYVVTVRRGNDGFLVDLGALQCLVDGYEVSDELPEVPGFYRQYVPRLFLRADTLEVVNMARPRA
jgi:hypothetical protein